MRIIFMGTPDFAVAALKALVSAGHEVVAAYTQPPRPGGRRGKELTPTPVHRAAEELGIAVRHPVSLKGAEEQAEFAALQADVAVVAAYGLILPQAVLDAPKLGCLNIHASLLPRWRGAAPIQRAILAGDAETGVTIMQMEAGLDTGPVRFGAEVHLDDKTAGEVTRELAELGAWSIVKVLSDPSSFPPVAQSIEGVTYAHKINKSELRLRFNQSCDEVIWQILGLNPPGAYFEFGGERIRILQAIPFASPRTGPPGTVLDSGLAIACNRWSVRPTLVQRAGRSAMSVEELLRGFPIPVGTSLA